MITIVGGIFITTTLLALAFKRSALVWLLSASVPFAATAAVTVGNNSFPPFYLIAAVVSALAVGQVVQIRSLPRHPALAPLFLFSLWALVVTAIAAGYFQGISVLVPRGGIDQQVSDPGTLTFSTSNIAQCLYLLLGLGVVVYLAQREHISPHVLSAGFGIGSMLSSANLVIRDAWPGWLFDNYAGVSYWMTDYQGVIRHRGIFPEPSYLAVFSTPALVYSLILAVRGKGRDRLWYTILAAAVALNLTLSYSGTAIVGVLVMAGLAGSALCVRFIFFGAKVRPGAIIWSMLGAAALTPLIPTVVRAVTDLVLNKQGSQSFANRTTADLFSFQVLADTYGLGAGLGSNRPSSMLAMLISCVGLIGTVLFVLAVGLAIGRVAIHSEWTATAWAALAVLVTKFVAEPALSTPLMWFTIGLCVYAGRKALYFSDVAVDSPNAQPQNLTLPNQASSTDPGQAAFRA